MPIATGEMTILTTRSSGTPVVGCGTSIASPGRSCTPNLLSTPCTVVPLVVMRPMPSMRVGGVCVAALLAPEPPAAGADDDDGAAAAAEETAATGASLGRGRLMPATAAGADDAAAEAGAATLFNFRRPPTTRSKAAPLPPPLPLPLPLPPLAAISRDRGDSRCRPLTQR